MRKHRQLETVLTVCRGTTDPRHPHTGRATEATDNSQVPDPAQDSTGKQPATPRAWALLSPDSLELGPRFEAGCGHPPEPLDSAPRRPWVPRWEGAREPQVHKLAVSAWVTGFTTQRGERPVTPAVPLAGSTTALGLRRRQGQDIRWRFRLSRLYFLSFFSCTYLR